MSIACLGSGKTVYLHMSYNADCNNNGVVQANYCYELSLGKVWF